jgi:hypothetical protein
MAMAKYDENTMKLQQPFGTAVSEYIAGIDWS